MAELNKHLFGKLKGKFGNAVFRQRNGKNYISQRPSSYTPPNDENFFNRTNKFRIASKIASVINSNEILKAIWINNIPKNSNLYNYLISKNYPAIDNNSINGLIQIAPDSKVAIRVDSVTFNQDSIIITLSPLTESSMINPTIEKKVKLISLLFLSSDSNSRNFDIIQLESTEINFDLYNPIIITQMLSTMDENKIFIYQNKSLHSCLITFDDNNNLVNYSNTFSYNLL
jgi:hypothetical protein